MSSAQPPLIQILRPTPAPGSSPIRNQLRYFWAETKAAWQDAWQYAPYLEPLTATHAAAPAVSQAQLLYRFGQVKREDLNSFAHAEPLEGFVDRLVRIRGSSTVQDPGSGLGLDDGVVLWVGLFTRESLGLHGQAGSAGTAKRSGDQVLLAHGLESLLHRQVISTALAKQGEIIVRIGRVPRFNERADVIAGSGRTAIGNRSTLEEDLPFPWQTGPDTSYVFANEGAVWSAADILNYLLASVPPDRSRWPRFVLSGHDDDLDQISGRILDVEGRSIGWVLNQLCDRRRGLGWCVRALPGELGTVVAIHIFTTFGEDIDAGGTIYHGNREKVSLTYDDDVMVRDLIINRDEHRVPDQVIARGQRILSCFSVSIADGSLEPAWATDDETGYLAGSSSADATLNDLARTSDRFQRVFTTFRVPDSWDWTAGNGEGALGPEGIANPYLSADGYYVINADPDQRPRWWHFGRALERTLPIDEDYGTGLTGAEPRYRLPFVAVMDDEDRWNMLHSPGDPSLPRGSLVPLAGEFGFELRLPWNHAMAPPAVWDTAQPSNFSRAFDYTSGMIATIAVRTDAYFEARQWITQPPPDREPETLTIYVPEAEFWIIAPNTAIDVDYDEGGELIRFDAGANGGSYVLRSDRDLLLSVAGLALAWWGQPRASVRVRYADVETGLQVGNYVIDIEHQGPSPEPIGTPITSIALRFGAEGGGNRTSEIMTAYTELDVRGVAANGGLV